MITLRQARPEDLAALRALVEAAYAPWVPVIGRRPGPMDDDYAARIDAGAATIAVEHGRVVALLVTERRTDHLLVDNVAVAASEQGRGLGRRLLAEAERQAREAGLGRLRLYTHAKMASNVALYARAGFTEVARISEKGFDRVYMEKPLPKADGAAQ